MPSSFLNRILRPGSSWSGAFRAATKAARSSRPSADKTRLMGAASSESDRPNSCWQLSTLHLTSCLLAAALITWAVAGRLLIETPNFKSLGASALLAGFLLRDWRWAVAVPLVALCLSDLWLGGYQWGVALAVYSSTAVYGLLGYWGRRGRLQLGWRTPQADGKGVEPTGLEGAARAWGLATLGSAQFFLLTNLAVWLCSGWYGMSWSEGARCFIAAVPFYKWTLLSDWCFFAVPLSAWYLVIQPWCERAGGTLSWQRISLGSASRRGN